MKQLATLLRYLKIFDVKNCIIKADANVSIRQKRYVRVEVKNISGFKEIERALSYEIERQKNERVMQETRGWDSEKGITVVMRRKEAEEDYGYITEPNLVPIDVSRKMREMVRDTMPELAPDKMKRYVRDWGVDKTDARIIADDADVAELFEAAALKVSPIFVSRWIRKEFLRVLNTHKINLSDTKLTAHHIIDLLRLLADKKISDRIGQQLLDEMIVSPFLASDHVKKEGLEVVTGSDELTRLCREAVKKCPRAVDEYRAGTEKSINFIVGYVMKMTKGKADAGKAKELIKELL
jgi:aspartyl-tRNA(Asn)/glutamyl-tRNA(Gln) amidotransferase subunit B